MTFPLSAGVYENIIDDSFIVDGAGPLTGAIVLTAERGPTTVTTVRSKRQLASLYGTATPDNPQLYAAQRFMRYGRSLTVLRMTLDATTATADIMDITGTGIVCTIESANPGAWGNDIGIKISDPIRLDPNIPDLFVLEVFEKGERVERFEVSRDVNVRNGFGNAMFIEDVINERSRYIIVEDQAGVAGDYERTGAGSTGTSLTGGADDTGAVPISDVVDAWVNEFKNEELVDADILIQGGWGDESIQAAMIEVAEDRSNCRAILDVPEFINDDVSLMINWRETTMGVSTNKAALYGGWIRVYDSNQNREVMIPPSGDVAGLIVNTFQNFEPWDAVAGMRRGVINGLGVSKIFSEAERDDLYLAGINPVTTYGGVSAVIWGQKTLQKEASALDRLNVINSVMWMTDRMKNALSPFIFEPNNQFVRDNINYILTQFLEGVLTRGGLYDFRVDTESSNTPQVIDQNQLIVDIWIKPIRAVEYIRLNVTVTPTGVELDSL